MWYFALLLYGLATIKLGSLGNTVGWILFNALALIISVGWGLITGCAILQSLLFCKLCEVTLL